MEKFPSFSAHVQFTFKWKELLFQYTKFIVAKALWYCGRNIQLRIKNLV